ncbi:MAG: hypothetical protein SF187_09330 [Deltaproteobacteria bacterium]|nr:hypothetical protein [Deltaproteobacteria bacterium]
MSETTKDVAGLWQANRNWLLGRARKLAGSAADDLVQEVFTLVITLSPTPKHCAAPGSMVCWSTSIVHSFSRQTFCLA